MSEIKFHPKKRLGQNFLRDEYIQNKIIDVCVLTSDDIVVEVGPGLGALTGKLAQKAKKVIAVELDRDACAVLYETLATQKNIEIVCMDFLKFNLAAFKTKIKIIGNLPFYITTPLITHIINQRASVDSVFITVQKEVAQRIVAKPGGKDYGALTCFVQFYCEPKILFDISKNCFWPRPQVDASFVCLKIREAPAVKVDDEKDFFNLIHAAFNQRRKKISNSLQGVIARERLPQIFSEAKIDANSRAENLSLADFAAILNLVKRLQKS